MFKIHKSTCINVIYHKEKEEKNIEPYILYQVHKPEMDQTHYAPQENRNKLFSFKFYYLLIDIYQTEH